tara:strand:- start:897 stop:1019 length:123 start_codon:yes stop_codon:yes gene_type:complete
MKYKLEKSIIFNTDMIDFKKDLDQAWNKLKSEIVLIRCIK